MLTKLCGSAKGLNKHGVNVSAKDMTFAYHLCNKDFKVKLNIDSFYGIELMMPTCKEVAVT